jgi:molybdopterin converting factor small subunit
MGQNLRVTVKLYGTLRRLSQPSTPGVWIGEIPSGSRINDLLVLLGAGIYEANAASMNGESCSFDTEICDGAEIVLVTPMGGG